MSSRDDTASSVTAIAVACCGALVLVPLAGLVHSVVSPPVALFPAPPAAPAELLRLLGRSIGLAAGVALVAVPVGTWLGWAEQRSADRSVRWLSIGCLLPLAVPSYVLAGALREQVGPGGRIGGILAGLGLELDARGLGAAALVLVAITTPLVQLLVSASLSRLSAAEEEAARALGASSRRVLRQVVLPRLRPAIAYGFLLSLLYVVSDFGAVAVLDAPVLTWRLYQAAENLQTARAASIGLALLAATAPLIALGLWIRGGSTAASVANPRPAERRPLGRTALAATWSLQAFVLSVGLVLPIATLVDWAVTGLALGRDFASVGVPLLHSGVAAFLGCAAAVAIAWFPAWAGARGQGRIARALEPLVYATAAIPGILVAFGLLSAALAVSRATSESARLYAALTGSGVLLALGFAVRFLPESYAPLRSAAQAVDDRVLDSARVLGASPLRVGVRVVAPLVAPGTTAAALLTFIAVVKELPISLLVGGAMGLRPLSYRLWDRLEEGFLHDAGLTGLVLVAVALAATVATLRYRTHA